MDIAPGATADGRPARSVAGRARAAWYLRRLRSVGPGAEVSGNPDLQASDLVVGKQFKVYSGHRRTLVCGWGRIRVGDRCLFNSGVVIFSVVGVSIGDDVALAGEVYVMDSSSHGVEAHAPQEAPVRIGDGTWVGARAMILPGVTLGRRVVVAAGSVVTRDVPDDCMVGGNPARLIRRLDYPWFCQRAWHDGFCSCPGSMLGPPLPEDHPPVVLPEG